MICLNTSPLDLSFEDGRLFVLRKPLAPGVRRLGDMKGVLLDEKFLSHVDLNTPLYSMYRDLCPELGSRHVRYDITILNSFVLGSEFNKTLGHYHPAVPDSNGLSYTEVYEVLHGKAHYLLQKKEGEKIVDVLLVKAEAGDVVPIPPNYGHVTINPSSSHLVMANLVCNDFESVYEDYKKKKGAAYFELTTGELIKNPRYGALPEIRAVSAPKAFKQNILAQFLEYPASFDFLTKPGKYSFKL